MPARLVPPALLALVAVTAPALAQTQLMKCWEANGRVSYSDRGCDGAASTRELRVSPWGSEAAPVRKPVTLRSTQKASEAGAGATGAAPTRATGDSPGASGLALSGGTATTAPARGATATTAAPAERRPAGLAAAPGAEDQVERERMQAQRDEYRRDVNRTRDLRSKFAPLGY